jgi:hypothetical protein
MFRTRRRRWIAFAILTPFLTLAIAACLVLGAANSSRFRFDRLQEGMTVAEASEVLGRDLSKDSIATFSIGSLNNDLYYYTNTIWILTTERYRVNFFCDRLSTKKSTKPTLEEFWSTTKYNAKKLLDR